MKKAISLLVGAVVAQGFAANAMAEGPIDGKIYGKINTAIVVEDNGITEDSKIVNNASRLGFKGESELDGGLKAVYKLEYEIAPDEKAADEANHQIFKQRDAYVGLKGGFGTVLAGSHDTPLKKAQGKVDQFNDLPLGDLKNLSTGMENREQDILVYASPSFEGISVMAAHVMPDNAGNDAFSVSASYQNDMLFAAIAIDEEIDGTDTSAVRVAAQAKMDMMTFGAVIDSYDNGTTSKDGVMVSGAYTMDKITLKAQYGQSDIAADGTEQLALGADYKLGKMTKAYGAIITLEDDMGKDMSAYMLGLEHKF